MYEDELRQEIFDPEKIRRLELQEVFDKLVKELHQKLNSGPPNNPEIKKLLKKIEETAHLRLDPNDLLLIYITEQAYMRIDAIPSAQNIFGVVKEESSQKDTYHLEITTPSDRAKGQDHIITEITLGSNETRLEVIEKREVGGIYIVTGSRAFIFPQDIVDIKIKQRNQF